MAELGKAKLGGWTGIKWSKKGVIKLTKIRGSSWYEKLEGQTKTKEVGDESETVYSWST